MAEAFVAQNPDCAQPNHPAQIRLKSGSSRPTGDRHVRFDERGWETERCRMAQATAPILDSTEAVVRKCPLLRRLWGLSGHRPANRRTLVDPPIAPARNPFA